MNNSKIESLNKELEKLEVMSDIIGIAIANRNGLLTTSILPIDVDERKFGAMAATMFGAIETAALTLRSNTVNNITVEFNNYQIIVMGIDDQVILVSMLDINTNLGIFFIEIEEAIKNIKKILSR
ncbi:MAG: roadblock/LC7 domain-containing protein [Candidatus Lokiarchaeota archaeon]|nr:roadblock/LC7 domain-containing protein [Candidatus Lokiarchaeota archaeon]